MRQLHSESTGSLPIPAYFGFPFEVIMFICCASHTMIAIISLAATMAGVYGYPTATTGQNKKPMCKLVKACTAVVIVLNGVFSMITFYTMIFVGVVKDQQRWGTALSIHSASTLLLKTEMFMIVPYVLGRVEIARRSIAKYE